MGFFRAVICHFEARNAMKLLIKEISSSLSLGALLLLSCSAIDRIACGSDSIQTVALTGQQAPNTDATFSRFFVGFSDFNLNNNGQIAFSGELVGVGIEQSNNTGIWMYEFGSGLKQFLREGDTVPAGDGQYSGGFFRLSLNNSGQLGFIGSVNDGGSGYSGVWIAAGTGSGLVEVVRSAEIAPETGLSFRNFSRSELSDNGKLVFSAELGNGFGPDGVWRRDEIGNLSLVALEGNNAPGTSTTFSSFGGYSVNKDGRIVFVSGLLDVFGGATQTAGIWRDRDDGLELLARFGDPSPGTSVEFENFGFGIPAMIDSNGRAAFSASLQGVGVNGTNNSGIWSERNGDGLELVYRSGGLGLAGLVETFFNVIQNSESRLAFYGSLRTPLGSGFFSENQDGNLAIVAQEGMTAPGSQLAFWQFSKSTLAFNDNGQAAFLADIRDPNTLPRPSLFTGIWAQDIHGDLQLVALEGEMLDVSDDPSQPDLRTIASLDFGPNGFNDLGQLMFSATFTDGTNGIFLSNLVGIPEPSTLTFMAISWLALCSQMVRWRRI